MSDEERAALAEKLGEVVREAWIECKLAEMEEGRAVPPDHIVPWAQLDERNKAIDRCIAMAVVTKYLELLEDVPEGRETPYMIEDEADLPDNWESSEA